MKKIEKLIIIWLMYWKKKNIDCNMIQVINNIDNVKKIAKENYTIIDQLEIDLES